MSNAVGKPGGVGSRAENGVVYATGLVQGIVLVTFPAASSIFTARIGYGLSTTQYGTMFVPQVLAAIAAALLGGRLIGRFGAKRVYLAGLAAALASMLVLALSQFLESNQTIAYPLLLLATASLGAGFGLTVPTLNTFAAAFHPRAVDRSVLVLNALLGLGTALAPVFVAVFVGLGFWWGLPILSSALVLVLFLIALRLPLRTHDSKTNATRPRAPRLPKRFWFYAAIAVLYGIVETMSGNWSRLLMTSDLRASAVSASLALTAFWAMVAIGRIAFAGLQRVIPARWIYRVIPLVVAAGYVLVLLLSDRSPLFGIAAFGLAGLGCSALLPLTVSFAEEEFASMPTAVAGRLIAFYQIGYGIAAFGVGPVLAGGASLASTFGIAAIVAVLVGIAAVAITRRPRAS
ncbi:MAG: MFS transporter [Lacisediminihabitans sp.]